MQAPTTLANVEWKASEVLSVRRAGLVQRGGPAAPRRGLWLEALAPVAHTVLPQAEVIYGIIWYKEHIIKSALWSALCHTGISGKAFFLVST